MSCPRSRRQGPGARVTWVSGSQSVTVVGSYLFPGVLRGLLEPRHATRAGRPLGRNQIAPTKGAIIALGNAAALRSEGPWCERRVTGGSAARSVLGSSATGRVPRRSDGGAESPAESRSRGPLSPAAATTPARRGVAALVSAGTARGAETTSALPVCDDDRNQVLVHSTAVLLQAKWRCAVLESTDRERRRDGLQRRGQGAATARFRRVIGAPISARWRSRIRRGPED